MVPRLSGPGVLVCGDAAMLCMNLGYMVRGMDFATASGQIAAKVACEALDAADLSDEGLGAYRKRLEETFVLGDMETFQRFPRFMESTHRMFDTYPALARDVMLDMFKVDGDPMGHLKPKLKREVGKVGMRALLHDVRGGMKAL